MGLVATNPPGGPGGCQMDILQDARYAGHPAIMLFQQQLDKVSDYGTTPNRFAKSAGIISFGLCSNVIPARFSARTIRATHPCWPRSGTLNRSPRSTDAARSRKLNRPYFCRKQEYAKATALLRSESESSR